MPVFVFEIGLEEMPARFLPELEQGIADLARNDLTQECIPWGRVQVFSTPRRLVLRVDDLGAIQERRTEVVTGPPKAIAFDAQGALGKAGKGFARSQGVSEEDLFVQDTAKGEYLAVRKEMGGEETARILPDMCARIIAKLSMPKRMRWEESGFSFARPIRWILAVLDAQVILVQAASLQAGRQTWGHRVHGPGPWTVHRAEDYFDLMHSKAGVILDREERKSIIRAQGDALAAEQGGTVVWTDDLLEEVASLVELPKPVLVRFDAG